MIQKKQNEFSEIVFPFYYECVCVTITCCPINNGRAFGVIFSVLPDSSFYQSMPLEDSW